MLRELFLVLFLAISMIAMGCDDGDSDCAVGSVGCACTSGGECDGDLTCASDLCVDLGGDSDSDSDVDSDSDTDADADTDSDGDVTAEYFYMADCIDKEFARQYSFNKIADLGLFMSGGGLTIPILSGKPFIHMINHQLHESHVLGLRKRLQYWSTDDSHHRNRSRYLPLIDVDFDDKMNIYFDPEYVFSAVSYMLNKITID